MALTEQQDAYGWMMRDTFQGKNRLEIVERDDGHILASPTPEVYFAPLENWPQWEQAAIRFAHGRMLDFGCGAGRVGLYAQEHGLDYLGIDISPGALEVCRLRGVPSVRQLSITQVNRGLGVFDTLVMFCNNFGLFGGPQRAKWLLRRFYKLTTPGARILATSTDVYWTDDPVHLAYHERNRRRGRMAGQLRLRIRYRTAATPWFDYLIVSPAELAAILEDTGWEIEQRFTAVDGGQYSVVLQKAQG